MPRAPAARARRIRGGPALSRHVVIGAGPAGLTAGWHLARRGADVVVLEADPTWVGGLARTMEHDGFRYDVGPHRFYTKSDAVRAMWHAMLPHDFLEIARLTRIYYERQFYPYPLAVGETLRKIGYLRAAHCAASWAAAKVRPRRPERSFEDWIVNRFGHELYATFFRTYTEKVWGVPCTEINADWAAQRIRGLSLTSLIGNALLPASRRGRVKSLVERFEYPRLGAGQVWEAVRDEIEARGGRVALGRDVVRLRHRDGRVVAAETADGRREEGDVFYATMTLAKLVAALDPPPPPEVRAAGAALRHRDFMTVALVVPRSGLFPDQWIYVHDPEVRVARITNYANWSPALSPDPARTVLGMEYFCDRGDGLWSAPDAAVLARAVSELARIGLGPAPGAAPHGAAATAAPPGAARDGPGGARHPREPSGARADGAASDGAFPTLGGGAIVGRVHRLEDAYPVYDGAYAAHRETLRRWLGASLRNLQPAGRKGLHNYNSQDHAMMTATLAVRRAVDGLDADPWSVNTEREYAEEGAARADIEERLVPRRLPGERGDGTAGEP